MGQNFLKDPKIITQIVEVGNITSNDSILEVGPGTGNLTEFILERSPKILTVIEKDERLIGQLKKFGKNKNFSRGYDEIFF